MLVFISLQCDNCFCFHFDPLECQLIPCLYFCLFFLVSISDRLCSGNPEIAIKSIENLHGTIAPSFCLKVLGTLLICDNKDIRQAAGKPCDHCLFLFILCSSLFASMNRCKSFCFTGLSTVKTCWLLPLQKRQNI